MNQYADVLEEELQGTAMEKSFAARGQQQEGGKVEEEEATPLDVDMNLVRSLLESYSSQQGGAGPASNLAGMLGVPLPKNAKDIDLNELD